MKNNQIFSGRLIDQVSHEYIITKTWINIGFPIAAAGLLITFFFLIYVCVKIYDGTLVGNQSLGIILLTALLTLYLNVFISASSPSATKCTIRQIAFSLSLTLVYGILLVKVMQLRSLVLVGLGGRLSYLNHYIMLFFVELVQIVLIIHVIIPKNMWYRTTNHINCTLSILNFVMLYTYPSFLSLFTFVYGLSGLTIRRNYKEGHWITLACGLSVPVTILWFVSSILMTNLYHELITSICILLLSTIMLLVIFLPKLSVMSKKSKHFMKKSSETAKFRALSGSWLSSIDKKEQVNDYVSCNPVYQV